MRLSNPMNAITLLLVIIGGLNWGLVGIFDYNLVESLFGTDSIMTNLVYVLVGLSAIYLIAAVAFGRSREIERPEVKV